MTCPPNAVPHILARPFNGIGDSDPDEGFDVDNDFQPDDPDFAVFNICDNTTLVKCQPCGALPQAYHAFNSFRVFENTNAPFQPRAEPYIVDIIKCSDFDGFTVPPFNNIINSQPIFFELCRYASSNGLQPFSVKLVSNPPFIPSVPVFNVPTECNNIPNQLLQTATSYSILINGLNCNKGFTGATGLQDSIVAVCLNEFFDFSTITSSTQYLILANNLCISIEDNCPDLLGDPVTINLIEPNGNIVVLLDLSSGSCVLTGLITTFVIGQIYTLTINNSLYRIFTVTS
jgi:hypothetical protein